MKMKRLETLLALLLALALAMTAFAGDDDDDGGRQQPLKMSVSFTSEFEDGLVGVCKARKRIEVTFCGNTSGGSSDDDDGQHDDDDGLQNNDDDDGGPIRNKCRVCGDNQFEYIIRMTARSDALGTVPITEFSYPVPMGDVEAAGWTHGPGTREPTSTTESPSGVEWNWLPPLMAGETSEDLYVCSFKGPDLSFATVSCLFAIDAPAAGSPPNCLGPAVDCSQPAGKNGLGEDDDDGHGDDDDGQLGNDDDDDGGGFNPSCPTGPFAHMGGHDDDDDD